MASQAIAVGPIAAAMPTVADCMCHLQAPASTGTTWVLGPYLGQSRHAQLACMFTKQGLDHDASFC